MNRSSWQTGLTIACLLVATVMLTGCPKKPAPAASAPGSGAPSAGSTTGTGTAPATAGSTGTDSGTTPGAIGTGPGSTPGTTGSGPGSAAPSSAGTSPGPTAIGSTPATGTTIPALPSPKEFVETSALKDVLFDFDRYEIRVKDKQTLDENGRWLKTNAGALLLIEGHCDERGTNEYNLALGERRAKATRDYLVSTGIDAGRITVISYGEERPVCTERTEACWARNRRAHFLVKQ